MFKYQRLCRSLCLLTKEVDSFLYPRAVSRIWQNAGLKTSGVNFIKEIRESQEGKLRVIEGILLPSPREAYLLSTPVQSGACPVCRTGLDVKHTDVLILSQFVRPDGCMLPRRVTGLCKKQQKRIAKMVAMAQKAGLMSNLTPENSKKDPKKRREWKKFNAYYDETTIKC